MCQGCFDNQWEDRDVYAFMETLPLERLEMIQDCRVKCTAESATSNSVGTSGFWMGTALHGAIDDDNYDCEAYYTDEERSAPDFCLTPAEEAWALLDEDERSVVVALLVGYAFPSVAV